MGMEKQTSPAIQAIGIGMFRYPLEQIFKVTFGKGILEVPKTM